MLRHGRNGIIKRCREQMVANYWIVDLKTGFDLRCFLTSQIFHHTAMLYCDAGGKRNIAIHEESTNQ